MNNLVSTLKSNLGYIYGVSITLLNTDVTSAIPKTIVFLAAAFFKGYMIAVYVDKIETDAWIYQVAFAFVGLTTYCFLFLAISYTLIFTQAHLFVKNQLSERQTKQMEDVLLEIDDGVMILEEKENEEDKENSFSTVEFANSFMQRLFRSSFKKD